MKLSYKLFPTVLKWFCFMKCLSSTGFKTVEKGFWGDHDWLIEGTA